MDEQIREFMNRDSSYLHVQKGIIEPCCSMIDDTVVLGSAIFLVLNGKLQEGYADVPVLFSIRHIVELLDALSVLIGHSSIESCKPILRAISDTYLGLAYMLEDKDEDERKKRTTAYMVCYFHNRLKMLERLDLSKEEGKRLYATLQRDRHEAVRGSKFPDEGLIKEMIEDVTAEIQHPILEKAEQEYQNIKATKAEERKRRRRARGQSSAPAEGEEGTGGGLNFEWYSMFGGPQDIERLADRLRLTGLYEGKYRRWSDAVHGRDLYAGRIHRVDEENYAVLSLRTPFGIEQITVNAMELASQVFTVVIARFLNEMEGELIEWYNRNKPNVEILSGGPIIIPKVVRVEATNPADEPSS